MKKTLKPLASIFLFSLLPVALFCIKGYSGDDFFFHVPSWMELRDTWQSGQMWSGWAFKANYTLGDPHFCFYPPFSFLVGGGLAILLPLRFVPCVYMSLVGFMSGLCMYIASRRFIPRENCLLAALLYMLSPYLVTSQLIHFTIAELLVQAWLPLILLCFFETVWEGNTQILMLGCLLGLSWLTDVPVSIVLIYCLLLVSIFSAWELKRLEPVLRFVAAEALGAMLAAFYLLPVFVEKKWIDTNGLLFRFLPSQFVIFLPGQWAAEGKVPSWVVNEWADVCVSVLVFGVCIYSRHRWRKESAQIRFWIYLTLITLFVHLPISLPLWNWLPQMRAVQFPFRFLPLVGVALPMVLFAKGTPLTLRKPVYVVMLLLTLIPVQRYLRGAPITRLGRVSFARLETEWEHTGYFSPPEYGHVTGRAFGIRSVDAIQNGGSPGSLAEQLCNTAAKRPQARKVEFTTDSNGVCHVVLDVYFYPYWRALDESGTFLATSANAKGLLSVAVPAGRHTVQVFFQPISRLRTVSSVVSLLTLAFAILGLLYMTALQFNMIGGSGLDRSEMRRVPIESYSEKA